MSSVGLNKWIVSGNLAADAEIKTVELKSGEKAKVAEATMYVRKPRSRDESFTVRLSIWESSTAWRRLPYLTKGSLIICTGSVEPSPYLSTSDNKPKAGLRMNVVDIDLDNVRNAEEEDVPVQTEPVKEAAEKTTPVAQPSAATNGAAKNGGQTTTVSNGAQPTSTTNGAQGSSTTNGKNTKAKSTSGETQQTGGKEPAKA
jgi:single-strand DNA-binding protein